MKLVIMKLVKQDTNKIPAAIGNSRETLTAKKAQLEKRCND